VRIPQGVKRSERHALCAVRYAFNGQRSAASYQRPAASD